MEIIARFILTLVANLAAVLMAAYFIPDFHVTADIQGLFPIVMSLTIINIFLRPIIKLILSPLIIITFGFFTIFINAIIIYAVDIYSNSLTINGLSALLLGTLIISLTNMVINHAALFLYRRPELS